MTYIYLNQTQDDLPDILTRSELQFVGISDIRITSYSTYDDLTGRTFDTTRIEVDCEPNPEGQVILPTVSERLQAAETLINLILDEGAI